MPLNLRQLRRKIKTTRHIGQITRAMKLVAAARLRRVQQAVQAGRPYYEQLQKVLTHVAAVADVDHAYLQPREVTAVAVLVAGGDRGLCGAFNSSLWQAAAAFIESQMVPVKIIAVGNQMQRRADRAKLDVLASWPGIHDPSDTAQLHQVANLVREIYEQGQVDCVQAIYADFASIMRYPTINVQLLPIPQAELAADAERTEYIFEPPAAQLLARLLPRAVTAQIYQLLLSTQAAEQAARMIAMSAATDNADEMVTSLTRQLNRARQEGITAELLDVVSGAQAIDLG